MNHLKNEKSPYLLQHVDNPVDWYPWGDEAFEKAKRENKPIFLSIGYSTCHWCHVMERESFENEKTAEIMNRHFVNIKVDREERPDVDRVYMNAVQTMTGQGGWPLSAFLTPELKPFYGGTYFPPVSNHGRPGFSALLERISDVWQTEKENVLQSAEQLIKELQHRHYVDSSGTEIDEAILKRAYHQIAAGYDPKYAGFGSGTKFPRPVVLNFLFRYYYRTQDAEALRMALTTLAAMSRGGMVDHLGGGFHRYSVDSQWRIPHFEKMLYDQAQLVHSYLDAYQVTSDEQFAAVARETLDYVLREMTSPEGGFFSAEDADSVDPNDPLHKKEGAFYVWEKSEMERFLTPDEAKIFCHYFSIEENGNALNDPHDEFLRKNIPYAAFTVEQTAEACAVSVPKAAALLGSAKKKLLAERSRRPRPQRDDKILTSWNGLMIGAFARGAFVLDHDGYRDAARNAAEFIFTRMYHHTDRTLFRRFREGEVKYEGHLDDYAFLVSGLLDLYHSTFDVRWVQWADELTGRMITLFWDSAEGGFYDTAGTDPSLLVRTKEAYDGAEPAGNSIAVLNLLRLDNLLQSNEYKGYAERSLRNSCTVLSQSPQVMPQMMCAVEYYRYPPQHVIVAAQKPEDYRSGITAIAKVFVPHAAFIILEETSREYFTGRHSFMQSMQPAGHRPVYYHCTHFSCTAPTDDVNVVIGELKAKRVQ